MSSSNHWFSGDILVFGVNTLEVLVFFFSFKISWPLRSEEHYLHGLVNILSEPTVASVQVQAARRSANVYTVEATGSTGVGANGNREMLG